MKQKTNGLAMASMIIGIVSFLSGWIPILNLLISGTGLTLGIISLNKINKNKKLLGKSYAIAGIVLNGLVLIGAIISTLAMSFYFGMFNY